MPEITRDLADADLAARPTNLAAGTLAGLSVLILGGDADYGRATAWLAARLGARVAVSGPETNRLAALAAALLGQGFGTIAVSADLRQRTTIEALFDELAATWGTPPDLVINAGDGLPMSAVDWDVTIDTQLNGSFNLMQTAARRWRDSGRPGSIVAVLPATSDPRDAVIVSAARASVVAFCDAVAIEWAPLGIRINCIAPMAVRADDRTLLPPRARDRGVPDARRQVDPWQVAETALFVGGPAGAFITGDILEVPGAAAR